MKTIRFALATAALLVVPRVVYAFPSQTPNANLNVSLGVLPTDGAPTTSAAFVGSTNYHAYHFTLLYDVHNGDGTYLNIQTYDHTRAHGARPGLGHRPLRFKRQQNRTQRRWESR